MSEREQQMYVTSVSSATVVLSPEPSKGRHMPAGTGIAQLTVTTLESAADPSFWGATGTCARLLVTVTRIG